MNNEEQFKQGLRHYRAPDASPKMEQKLWAAIARFPAARSIPKVAWWIGLWSWELAGFASALSVLVSILVSHWIGSAPSALPLSDIFSDVGGLL